MPPLSTIGGTPGLTQAQADAQAQAYVNANFSTQYPSATVSSLTSPFRRAQAGGSCPANTVCITASASVNTAFVRILGSQYNTLSAGVSTQVTTAQNYLEVVLVLDNTGFHELDVWQHDRHPGEQLAATTLVNTLFASDPTLQYVRIGVVPFTENVNAGTQYANAAWIDNANAANSMSQENIDLPTGTGLIAFASQFATAANNSALQWGGCVRQRNEPYDIEDVSPDPGNRDTLFTPFFAPGEPSGDLNAYLQDGTCSGTVSAIQRCVAKYTTSPQTIGN